MRYVRQAGVQTPRMHLALDFKRVKELANAPVLVDLRNIYNRDDMAAAGFTYVSVGRV